MSNTAVLRVKIEPYQLRIIKLILYATTCHHINNYTLENVDCSIEIAVQ